MHTPKVARACLGINSGVRDFRRELGTWSVVDGTKTQTNNSPNIRDAGHYSVTDRILFVQI